MLSSCELQERNSVKKRMVPWCIYLTCSLSLLFSYCPLVLFLRSCHEEGRFPSVPSSVSVKGLEVFEQEFIIALRWGTQKCVFLPILETNHEGRNPVGAAAPLRSKNVCQHVISARGSGSCWVWSWWECELSPGPLIPSWCPWVCCSK